MDIISIETAGGIKLPHSGRYVVYQENLTAVVDAALQADAKLSVLGKTSSNVGAAFIVAVEARNSDEKSAEEFFVSPPNAAGLSPALMAVVARRS